MNHFKAELFLTHNEIAQRYFRYVGDHWFHLKATDYYCCLRPDKIAWYDHRTASYLAFENVFDELPEDLQYEFLFYLNLFR